MPYRSFSRLLSIFAVSATVFTIAACGKQVPAAGPTATNVIGASIPPQPGHVYTGAAITPQLKFIILPQTAVQEKNGDILITDGGNWDRTGDKVVEMNPQGKVIWVYAGGMDFPHSAYPVPGTNDLIISDTNNDRVFEIDRSGKIIWTTDTLGKGTGNLGTGTFSDGGHLLYPNDAIVLTNNNILISSRLNSSIWEINKAGKVEWSCKKFMFRQHRPRFVNNDPNGSIMVPDSDHARVIIINHACSAVTWKYGGLTADFNPKIVWPRSFNTYPPGGSNYLIGDSRHNRVIEINPQGKTLQQWTDLPGPYYLEPMKNGNILMGNSNIHGAVVLGAHGGIVKQYPTTDPTKYPTSVVNGSFEQAGKDGTPTGWIKGDELNETLAPGQRVDMRQDTNVAHTGKASAKISWPSNNSHLFLLWQQTVAVTPGQRYAFSGWVKTKDVTDCKNCDFGPGSSSTGLAEYYLTFVQPGNPKTLPVAGYNPGGQYSQGTLDWSQESQTITIPFGVTRVNIQGMLTGKGTAWFDSVTFKKV